MSIGKVAVSCGNMHHGHFAAAFANEAKCSPKHSELKPDVSAKVQWVTATENIG